MIANYFIYKVDLLENKRHLKDEHLIKERIFNYILLYKTALHCFISPHLTLD